MTDFSNYKFRCSGLKHLMVMPRTKAAREAGELSDSTKTYLRDIFIKETFDREKPDVNTKYTKKGTMVEPDSMDLVQRVAGATYFKNNEHLENDFIAGTPDIITADDVKDIKSSWDIWTYAAIDEKKARSDYFYQLLGYMWLTGKASGELLYCLVSTPTSLIDFELYKISYSLSDPDDAEFYRKNYVFDDIPAEKRLKIFTFDFDEILIEQLKSQVLSAREYLKGLTL